MKENMRITARTSPLLTLNNGVQIPAIGLGAFQSPPEQTPDAVESARLQTRRHCRRIFQRGALDTAVRRGPEPDNITLETYGKEIPEA